MLCLPKANSQSATYRLSHLSINNGLSNNQINAIFQDSHGFTWIATSDGLNRFDGLSLTIFRHNKSDNSSIIDNNTYEISEDPWLNIWVQTARGLNIYISKTGKFKRDTEAYLHEKKLGDFGISSIWRDRKQNFWFLTTNKGLVRWSANKPYSLLNQNIPNSISDNLARDIRQANDGYYWYIGQNGILEKIDPNTLQVVYRNNWLQKKFSESKLYRLFVDSDNHVWVYIPNSVNDVFIFDPNKQSFSVISKNSGIYPLSNNIVTGITQDNQGIIWISTDHGGVNLIDKKKRTVNVLFNDPENPTSLSQNSISAVFCDNKGIIWLGTYKKGLDYYHENILQFPLIRQKSGEKESLPYEDVNRFVEDKQGNLWIATNGGGLIYWNRANNSFKRYRNDPKNANSLSNDVIVSLLIDRNEKLWIGTFHGGLNCFDGNKFTAYQHDPKNPTSISENNIWDIHEDKQGNLWIGTLGGGLDMFDRSRNIFLHYRNGDLNSVSSNYIFSLAEDNRDNLWIGTTYGINKYDRKSGRFEHYTPNEKPFDKLTNSAISCLKIDSRGWIWLGTLDGLNVYKPTKKTLDVFRVEEGLPSNIICGIVEDKQGYIWISTKNGIARIFVKKEKPASEFKIVTYDEKDGLQGREFNLFAAALTKRGEIIFGGPNGYNLFYPENIKDINERGKPFLTGLEINNQKIKPGDTINGRVILKHSLENTTEITLKYYENQIEADFSAIDYFNPEKNKFQYMLEGLDKKWKPLDHNVRKLVYTNLDAGTYKLKIRTQNNDKEAITSLKIIIRPPFWQTKIAKTIYVVLFAIAMFLIINSVQKRERRKFELAHEKAAIQHQLELDRMKIRFFTNISHDFRTPLSLIITPLEKLVKTETNESQKLHFQLILRNAKRLLSLVNQLLDFRKLETGNVKIVLSEGDLVGFVREIGYSFSDMSEKKDIRYTFTSPRQNFEALFDKDKLEKILFNLLSNAYKFTQQGGNISMSLEISESQKNEDGMRNITLKIKDSGIGIPADKQEKIFENFFQVETPEQTINQGTGIGLSIVKEFVKLLGGNIQVESNPDEGSCFVLTLPVKQLSELETIEPLAEEIRQEPVPENITEEDSQKPLLLLIDDNEDFRFYLSDNLKTLYRVTEAENGAQGWEKTLEIVPDLIVSDVMMPVMNGIELCKKIKTDARTSHIPLILLTARQAEEQIKEGFDTGADDYITKPFSFEILLSRVNNLIAKRKKNQQKFQKFVDVSPAEIAITSLDEKLLRKALDLVEKNMANPDFSVEELSRELGMSRVYLYKKLLSITGKSPVDFIRTLRMKRAAQLLEKSQLNVSEIAYQVGFNNPKYFAKCFKSEFNVLPSMYKKSETDLKSNEKI
jgi:signal transduction histidine kinase/ligand-binding sensor domain-containing protein/DNA-binding response OmpR family regulator